MKYTILLVVLCCKWRGSFSEEAQNKTKRGLIGQTDYISAFRPANVYADNSGAPTQAQAQGLAPYYPPKIVQSAPKPTFGPEPKVTTQQVLYEYQQTPHNTVSNVHLQYQTIPQNPTDSTPQTQQIAYSQYVAQQPRVYPPTQQSYQSYPTAQVPISAQYQVQPQFPPTQITPIQNNAFSTAETVVNPVQHSALIHHPPVVGKYIYLNGKVAYQPTNHHLQQHPLQRPLASKQPQQKLIPPTYSSPLTFGSFQPIEKTTIKPVPVKEEPKKEEEEEEEEEKAEIENEDENEEVREEDDEEEEEERPRYREVEDFSPYYNDEEDEDHGNYREDEEEEEDEDSRRGSSKHYHKKEPKRNYKHKSSYSTNKKYKSKPYKSLAKPAKYQAYKYSKGSNGKPKIETIEGKPSQNIPVTVQKVYREKWFITRNSNPQNEQ